MNAEHFKNSRSLKGAKVYKRRISVNLVDPVKSFQTSIYYLLAKFSFDTAENGPLKVCPKLGNS